MTRVQKLSHHKFKRRNLEPLEGLQIDGTREAGILCRSLDLQPCSLAAAQRSRRWRDRRLEGHPSVLHGYHQEHEHGVSGLAAAASFNHLDLFHAAQVGGLAAPDPPPRPPRRPD